MRPVIVHADEVSEREGLATGAAGAPFFRELSAGGPEARVARLPAGHRLTPLQARGRGDESVFVLAGRPALRWREPDGGLVTEGLRPGSWVLLRAGTGVLHQIVNPGPDEARLLVVGASAAGESPAGECVAWPEDPPFDVIVAPPPAVAPPPVVAPPAAPAPARRSTSRAGPWIDRADRHLQAIPPAWRVRTARLELRPWQLADVDALVALQIDNRDHLLPWMPWAQAPAYPDEAARRVLDFHGRFARGEDYVYGIFLDGAPIGGTGLHLRVGPRAAEIGYWVAKKHEGKGLVTEAARGMARVGLLLHDLDRIEIRMDPANRRSAAVPPRLGFSLETTLRRRIEGLDGLRDVHVWALYRDQVERLGLDEPLAAWDLLERRLA